MKIFKLKQIFLLTLLCLFGMSRPALSAEPTSNSLVLVKYTNMTVTSNSISFDVQLKAGSNYVSGNLSTGMMIGGNLRCEVYLGPGLSISGATGTPVAGNHNFTLFTASPTFIGTVPSGAQKLSFAISGDAVAAKDLGSSFITVGHVELAVTGGSPAVSKTSIIVRPYNMSGAVSGWSNLENTGSYETYGSPIIFVTPDGSGTGTSWSYPSKDLQGALNKAYTSYTSADNADKYELAAGVYVPYQVHMSNGTYSQAGGNFSAPGLVMKEGVNVYVAGNAETGATAGSVSISDDLYAEQYSESSAWRYFGMPFTSSIANIFSTTGNTFSVNTASPEVIVKYYDVSKRGLEASSIEGNNSANWRKVGMETPTSAGAFYSGNSLVSGYGYMIVADDAYVRIKATSNKNDMFGASNVQAPTVYFEHPAAASKEDMYKKDYGWNFKSNPFSSYYHFDGTNSNGLKDEASYSLYYWNQPGSSYQAISRHEEAYLPPFKPVFFQVDNTAPAFTFSASKRMPNILNQDASGYTGVAAKPFLRSGSESNIELLFLMLSDGSNTGKATVVINPEARRGYDLGWDLSRISLNGESFPEIWTETDGISYSVNELPLEGNTGRIPVRFQIGKSGEYTVSLGDNSRLNRESDYYLENVKTLERVSLSQGGTLSFHAQAGIETGDWTLVIDRVSTGLDASSYGNIAVYSVAGGIRITGMEEASGIEVYHAGGMRIRNFHTNNNEETVLVPQGVYIVKISGSTNNTTRKVIVK